MRRLKIFVLVFVIMATCGRLTRGFAKPMRTYLRAIRSTPTFTSQQHTILTAPSTIQPCTFAKPLSSDHKMVANIEIVSYDLVKDLPNHPEVLLIDVREPYEIEETGKIPTSINIPLATVRTELGNETNPEVFKAKYSRDKPCANDTIIFYCRSGRRSQEAAEYAVSLGYTNVKNYKGSWIDWAEHEGLPK